MTVKDAIDRFDVLYPNAMGLPEKLALLSGLDGRVDREILSLYGADDPDFAGYGPADYPDAALRIGFPFEDLYIKYLSAENDLINGDALRYANSAAVFNAAYAEYAAYMNRTRRYQKKGAPERCGFRN